MASILSQPQFQNPEAAREYLESVRWANGIVCPHCGVIDGHYKLQGAKTPPGLYKCHACADKFTVTVGTVFERSKVGLHLWLQAMHWMAASKKGVSAKQIERMLGVTYKTAWFMCHRIREAMTANPETPLGGPGSSGIVEADETFWGVQTDEEGIKYPAKVFHGHAHKMKIVSLVERDGEKRSFHVANVNANTVGTILRSQVAKSAHLMTDEASFYKKPGQHFASHQSVNHSKGEYARGSVTTNTVESSFAILKRGLVGTFHSVSEKHLQRYASEFDFRWNTRQSLGFSDVDRANIALKQIAGKRLTYRRIAFVAP